jgi:pyruvate/2-oxoglutarate dehydrogenase complex dihydrolipoamide acyltransferase (E2) component
MRRVVVMPPMGDAAGELAVAHWYKAPGDRVEKGETLFDVETEKVTVPVESLYAGTLTEVLIAEGATAAEGDPIAAIDDGAG